MSLNPTLNPVVHPPVTGVAEAEDADLCSHEYLVCSLADMESIYERFRKPLPSLFWSDYFRNVGAPVRFVPPRSTTADDSSFANRMRIKRGEPPASSLAQAYMDYRNAKRAAKK